MQEYLFLYKGENNIVHILLACIISFETWNNLSDVGSGYISPHLDKKNTEVQRGYVTYLSKSV